MLVGPVFRRELATAPRSLRLYVSRAGYVAALFGLVFTAWLILSQQVRGLGDLAQFGSAVFAVLAPLQLVTAVAFSALFTAAAVAQEKDRRTLDLLLMTRMTNAELVLGKLFSSMLSVGVLVLASLPLWMLLTLLGGVSYRQVALVMGVTFVAAAVSGSTGSLISLMRERTFQSLAMTALVLVLWVIVGEALASGYLMAEWLGTSAANWAVVVSPLRAIQAALQPLPEASPGLDWCGGPVSAYLLANLATAVLLNCWAIARVRVWNPSQQLERRKKVEEKSSAAAANLPESTRTSRPVWDNPILWREICTWAYGKKILVVKLAYLLIFVLCAAALWNSAFSADAGRADVYTLARPLVPLFVLSLVLVNALAVSSITNERDLRALDLLLVTDLTPKEIIFGKLGGIFYNSKEMLLLPLGLCALLWFYGFSTTENLVFLLLATLVMNAFVAMLGVHVGMAYSDSRTAVGVSLGTVLFLLLGIGICMRMMLAFQSSFNYQLQAFAAFMFGGGAALYMALGYRNPSGAIGWASFLAPFCTFFVITSFLGGIYGQAFLVTTLSYGFATAAMLIPAIDEFDVATGRTTSQSG